jgi:hypothetical protein
MYWVQDVFQFSKILFEEFFVSIKILRVMLGMQAEGM